MDVPARFCCCLLLCCTAAAADPQPPAAPAVPAAPAELPALAQCAAQAYDGYAEAMALWEKDWADGVAAARKDLAQAAQLRAEAQTLALRRDGLRIHYLAGAQPEALNLEDTVAALRLFDWPAANEQALRQQQASYASLADQTEQAQQHADSSPERDALEAYFEESFADAGGAPVARRLSQTLKQGTSALEQCRQAHPLPPSAE